MTTDEFDHRLKSIFTLSELQLKGRVAVFVTRDQFLLALNPTLFIVVLLKRHGFHTFVVEIYEQAGFIFEYAGGL